LTTSVYSSVTHQRDSESHRMPTYSDSLQSPSRNSDASISIELRLDDVNVAGHVGNTSLLRVIDEARSRFLGYSALGRAQPMSEGLLDGLGQTVRKVIAQQTIEYRKEVWYSHHPVIANMWISHVGTSSFALATAIYAGDDEPAVLAEATYVLLAGPEGRPWPIDAVIKDRLYRFVTQPAPAPAALLSLHTCRGPLGGRHPVSAGLTWPSH
jgi:acyl-CoA thioester hydrolase